MILAVQYLQDHIYSAQPLISVHHYSANMVTASDIILLIPGCLTFPMLLAGQTLESWGPDGVLMSADGPLNPALCLCPCTSTGDDVSLKTVLLCAASQIPCPARGSANIGVKHTVHHRSLSWGFRLSHGFCKARHKKTDI